MARFDYNARLRRLLKNYGYTYDCGYLINDFTGEVIRRFKSETSACDYLCPYKPVAINPIQGIDFTDEYISIAQHNGM